MVGVESETVDTPSDSTFLTGFAVNAHICSAFYHLSIVPVTAGISTNAIILSYDKDLYRERRIEIPQATLNTDDFQNLVLDNLWATYLGAPEDSAPPSFGGVTVVLGAFEDYKIDSKVKNPVIIPQGARIRQRFFEEALLFMITQTNAMDTKTFQARVSTLKKRVIVTHGIAVAIATIFFISLVLLLVVMWLSRPRLRPLNRLYDPASFIATVEMLVNDQDILARLGGFDDSPRKTMS